MHPRSLILTRSRAPLLALAGWALLSAHADAAEVVWLEPPSAEQAARVAAAAGATGEPLDLVDLRAAAARWDRQDDALLAGLDAALASVRPFETRLDGELVIMRDLERPLAAIEVIRGPEDREALFRVLAYQGFAVNRYFGDQLEKEEAAAPYRVEISELATERPWVDAVALFPEREITAYDIAEAPQRVAFTRVRDRVRAALPATLVPSGLPAGGRLFVDGAAVAPGPTGGIRVPPGRHYAHVELDGRFVARWQLRVAPGAEQHLDVALTDAIVDGWIARLGAGAAPPPELVPSIEALGGEVWLARPGPRGPEAWVVRADGVSPASLPREPRAPAPSSAEGLGGSVGLRAGWLSSANFALDDPDSDYDFAAVNALALSVDAALTYDLGPARFGVGVDAAFTAGEDHVARYGGDRATRLRPYLHVAAGHRLVQLTAGYTLPHHPTVGLRAQVPLVDGLEVQGAGWLGLATTRAREDGSEYDSQALYALGVGLGWRPPRG